MWWKVSWRSCVFACSLSTGFVCAAQEPVDLAELSIEELLNVEVTSVAKRATALADAPASIYVIDAAAIHRSGARTLPEILRLAPNLMVARIDPVQYAISARGFTTVVSNKLLVLIDGRTIYSPLFSGVFWEMHDLFVGDIERVEVISGPGATLWGANAVNGVINVITRTAGETQGTATEVAGGDFQRGGSIRFGARTGGGTAYRVFAKHDDWDRTARADGAANSDAWSRSTVGFRVDGGVSNGSFTVEGGAFKGSSEHRGFVGPFEVTPHTVAGGHVLGRWTRDSDDGSSTRVQAYYSHSEREEVVVFSPRATIFDLEVGRSITIGRHSLLFGGGYRRARDETRPGFLSGFDPDQITLEWENIFVHDRITVNDSLQLGLGVKFEWNDFSDLDVLPGARLSWRVDDTKVLWTSLSRSARAPARLDRDVFLPGVPPGTFLGGPNIRSEVADVLEIGYRAQPSERWTVSATAFYHDWDNLRSATAIPVVWENEIEGTVRGVEAWSSLQLTGIWRIRAGFVVLEKDLRIDPTSTDPSGTSNPTLHNDPDHHWRLDSSLALSPRWSLELGFRGVDELTVEPVPAYVELDVRLAWNPRPGLEFALTGRNLLHESHAEFGAASTRAEIPRTVFLGVRYGL